MSTQTSIHTVTEISVNRQFFGRDTSEAGPFHVTTIVAIDDKGGRHEFKLFHDAEPIAITGDVAMPVAEAA